MRSDATDASPSKACTNDGTTPVPGSERGTLEVVFSASGFTGDVYFADVDGDGATDVLDVETTGTMHVRKSIFAAGAPGLEAVDTEAPVRLPADGDAGTRSPPVLVVRDFDGDGRADVLMAGRDGTHRLWLRDPAGSGFIAPDTPRGVPASPGHGSPGSSAFGDFDGGGAIDSARIDLAGGRVSFFRFAQAPDGTRRFDRDEGALWDRDLPSPGAVGARYVDGATWAADVLATDSGTAKSEIAVFAEDAGGGGELTVLGLDFGDRRATPATPTTAPRAVTFAPWARGVGSPEELVFADLDRDGFDDLVRLSLRGGLDVFPGGAPHGTPSSSLGVPSDERRCVGSPAARTAFVQLDDGPSLDLVRVPPGRGSVDVWRGERLCAEGGVPIPSFGPAAPWRFVDRGVRRASAFQAKTWSGSTPDAGPEELALVSDGTLVVHRAAPPTTSFDPASPTEVRIRSSFEDFLSEDRILHPDPNYSYEAPVVELSAFRFLHGRRETATETLADAACLRGIGNLYSVRDRVRAYAGADQWLASSHIDLSTPPDSDPHDVANTSWDHQSRLILDFMTGYRLLGNPDFLRAAEAAGDRLLNRFGRVPIPGTDCAGSPCLSFVAEKSNGIFNPDPNQNLTIALSFALLMAAPESSYHVALSAGIHEYTGDAGDARSVDLHDVVTNEVTVAFSAQNADRDAGTEGALLMSGIDCYRSAEAYDTRYGAYAVQSALWLVKELDGQPWFATLETTLQPKLAAASAWLGRWSVSSGSPRLPGSYYCAAGCGGCSIVPLVEWDAAYRYAALHHSRELGVTVCPDVLANVPWTDEAGGFLPLLHDEFLGVPREFYASGCH